MSARAFVSVMKEFDQEAGRSFGFLCDEFGLNGPEKSEIVIPELAFHGDGLRYRISLDTSEKAVLVDVERDLETVTLAVGLDNLAAASRIVARNRVPTGAHTLFGLRKTLAAQAEIVRKIHPLMRADNAVDLLRRAGAQEWRRR